jgi:xanthine dehydrogenase/oxidase
MNDNSFCWFQEYKPPSSKDIPIDFRVTLLKNAPNPKGILSSKGDI